STLPAFKDVEAEIRSREERARLNERMKGYLADLEKKSYLYLDPPPQAAGFRGAEGEARGVEFPFVVPSVEPEGGGKDGKKAKGGQTGTAAEATPAAEAAAAADRAARTEAE